METEPVWEPNIPGEALESLQLSHLWMETVKQRGGADGKIQPMTAAEDVPLIGQMINVIANLEKRIIELEEAE
ncbi:hypothetical protein [Corynebacterium doosanense]|uniref:Uncharacterized protein n=1 Tax=Corynebacterium doosanense CAU 212 = DSM 45436 TaxID=558173 RepID=A0A097IJ46_9CORY|nr:hypothetical protein [Corynebacterium doosanense]AIT62167.1 hypothetical protein CDOO_01825 [Corynebacterium doosanense CAU 212 = DSM 45436]